MEAIEKISLQPVFLGHFDSVWFGGSYHFVEGDRVFGGGTMSSTSAPNCREIGHHKIKPHKFRNRLHEALCLTKCKPKHHSQSKLSDYRVLASFRCTRMRS